MDTKVLKSLQSCKLFEGMSDADITSALDTVSYRMVQFHKKELYAVEGDMCRHTDIVVKGEMTASMEGPSGKYVKVATLRRGDLMAPAFIFADNKTMPVTVEASTDVELLRMWRDDFHKLVDTDERVRWNFIRMLSNTNAFLTGKLRMLSLLSVREKLANMLLERARKAGSNTFTLERSRQEIADAFGIQKFSVTRQLAEFQEEGAIEIEGKTVTLLDPQKLIRH
jgi:CRP-like cAMP-binding protein